MLLRASRTVLVLAFVRALAGCGGGGGGGSSSPPPPPPPTFTDPTLYSVDPSASLPNAAELSAVTHHQVTLGGTTLNYTATAGHLTASTLAAGVSAASFFYVTYQLDGTDTSTM